MSEPDTSWSQEEIFAALDNVRMRASDYFKEHGNHPPLSMIYATRVPMSGQPGKSLVMVPPIVDFDEAGKRLYANMIRACAAAGAAVGIIFISETWHVSVDFGDEKRLREEYKGRLHEHPDRGERLMITCEHSRFGTRTWFAEITRNKAGKPSLGEWQMIPLRAKQQGQFLHLLPQVD
jgi:hypothetical protein